MLYARTGMVSFSTFRSVVRLELMPRLPGAGWLTAPPPGVGSALLFTFVSVGHFFPGLCDPRRCQVGQRLSNVPCAVPCHRASQVSLQERLSRVTFFLSHAFLDYLCINFFIRTLLLLHLCHLCKNLGDVRSAFRTYDTDTGETPLPAGVFPPPLRSPFVFLVTLSCPCERPALPHAGSGVWGLGVEENWSREASHNRICRATRRRGSVY